LLSVDQASERLGVGRTGLYGLVKAGRLVAVRPLAGELKFRAGDLASFVSALEPVDPETIANHKAAGEAPASAAEVLHRSRGLAGTPRQARPRARSR
jgi:excisionase family DNA binding protein